MRDVVRKTNFADKSCSPFHLFMSWWWTMWIRVSQEAIIELRMLHFSVEKREYNPPKMLVIFPLFDVKWPHPNGSSVQLTSVSFHQVLLKGGKFCERKKKRVFRAFFKTASFTRVISPGWSRRPPEHNEVKAPLAKITSRWSIISVWRRFHFYIYLQIPTSRPASASGARRMWPVKTDTQLLTAFSRLRVIHGSFQMTDWRLVSLLPYFHCHRTHPSVDPGCFPAAGPKTEMFGGDRNSRQHCDGSQVFLTDFLISHSRRSVRFCS